MSNERFEDRLACRPTISDYLARGVLITPDERDDLAEAVELLRRVEGELVPHHDSANEVAAKFGLGPIGAVDFIAAIRATLARLDGDE